MPPASCTYTAAGLPAVAVAGLLLQEPLSVYTAFMNSQCNHTSSCKCCI